MTTDDTRRTALIERIDKGIAHLGEDDQSEACDGCADVVKLLKIMRVAAETQAKARLTPEERAAAMVGGVPSDYAESAE